jgi:hypothetical protein
MTPKTFKAGTKVACYCPSYEIFNALIQYAKTKGVPIHRGTIADVRVTYSGYKSLQFDGIDVCATCTEVGSPSKTWISVDEWIKYCDNYKQDQLVLTAEYTAKIDFENKIVNVGCQKIPFDKVKSLYYMIKGKTSPIAIAA